MGPLCVGPRATHVGPRATHVGPRATHVGPRATHVGPRATAPRLHTHTASPHALQYPRHKVMQIRR